jgi:hypothetical protein
MPYRNKKDKNQNAREYWGKVEGLRRKKLYADNPDVWYWRSIKKRFGLSKERYEELYRQGCWLCGNPFPLATNRYGVHVDHDHEANVVRGLSHGACNLLIGHAKESPTLLRKIADALEAAQ